MADSREFFKMDVGYFDNPKVQSIIDSNPQAVLLHMRCIAYARQHRTDGLVPLRVALRSIGADATGIATGNASGNATFEAARNAGLLVDAGDGKCLVHDYAEHQQTAAELKRLSQRQSANARSRWHANGNASGTPSGNASGYAEKRREDTKSELSPDAVTILDLLDARIEENGAKKPSRSKANRDAARLLLDRDGHTVEEVCRVIDWATRDHFWRSNILSMVKLRAKYDQLRLKSHDTQSTQPTRQPSNVVKLAGGGEIERFW